MLFSLLRCHHYACAHFHAKLQERRTAQQNEEKKEEDCAGRSSSKGETDDKKKNTSTFMMRRTRELAALKAELAQWSIWKVWSGRRIGREATERKVEVQFTGEERAHIGEEGGKAEEAGMPASRLRGEREGADRPGDAVGELGLRKVGGECEARLELRTGRGRGEGG
jgi:hypothetical protein